jgi:hypothetical protein
MHTLSSSSTNNEENAILNGSNATENDPLVVRDDVVQPESKKVKAVVYMHKLIYIVKVYSDGNSFV